MILADLLTTNIVTAASSASVHTAFELMHEHHISAVVITDGDLPVGIVTERDAVNLTLKKNANLKSVSVADVMGKPLITAPPDMNYRDAYSLITDKHIRHLVVVADSGKLTGIVTEGDFLDHLGNEFLIHFKEVGSLMTHNVVTLPEDAILEDAIRLMRHGYISCVVVEKDARPTGIFTERDLVHLMAEQVQINSVPITAAMTSPVHTVTDSKSILDAEQSMDKADIRRLVVVDEKGYITGLITRHDIVKQLYNRHIGHLQETLKLRELELDEAHTQLQLERKLRRIEGRLFESQQLANIGSWELDITNDDLWWSNETFSIFEINPKQSNASYEAFLDTVHPEDQDFVSSIYTNSIANHTPYNIVHRLQFSDGRIKYINECCETFYDKNDNPLRSIGTVQDITRQIQAEKALQESEEKYRSLFTEAPDMIHIVDREGRIIDVNPAELKALGYTRDEFLGMSLVERIAPEFRKATGENLVRIQKGEQIHGHETVLLACDGSRLDVEVSISPNMKNGEMVSARVILRNISERKRAEVERERLNRELQQAHKMEALCQLTGSIAHDFNNLLGIILGFANLAEKPGIDQAKRLVYLKHIQEAGDRATKMVSQMLTYTRADVRKDEALQLGPLIKEDVRLLRHTLPSSITINTDIEEDLPDVIMDSSQLNQILVNLCINARDAMDGKGSLNISLHMVEIEGVECSACYKRIHGKWIELSIADTGTGIDKLILGRLFEPFFTTKKIGKGTGVGLTVVNSIIQSHGGHIIIESETGKRSNIRLLFPPSSTTSSVSRDSTESDEELPMGNGERLLIVDDEPILAEYMGNLMELHGYHVTVITDSHKALKHVQQNINDIDLLITDQTMPGLTGMELISGVREASPDIPVILCTGYSENIDKESAGELNVHYLTKPVNSDFLIKLVGRLVTSVK